MMFFLINDAAKANVIFLVTIKSYLSSKAVLMEEFMLKGLLLKECVRYLKVDSLLF